MSKSKSKKYQKQEEKPEEALPVSRETEQPTEEQIIPDGEFSEESKLMEQQPEENIGQAEATIEGEGSMISNVDEMDEASKPSIDTNGAKEEIVLDEIIPVDTKPKPLSWAERLEARNAERARRQEEWQQRIQDKKDQMQR